MIKRRVHSWFLCLLFGALFFFLPQLVIAAWSRHSVYETIASVPAHEYGILFGAYVNEVGSLADVTRERASAAALLYHTGKIKYIFVSATERANHQATAIAAFLEAEGVPAAALLIDEYGIDSGDTCRHFAVIAQKGILITQSYHLPRTLLLCQKEGVQAVGLAVNRLGLLESRGNSPLSILFIRIGRFVREASLTWLTLLGLYDKISNEAETTIPLSSWSSYEFIA